MTKPLSSLVFAACALLAAPAFAVDGTCTEQAAAKKLAGAAKTSFIKKCEKDAAAAPAPNAACLKAATDKKLAGAAKNSFMKKCEADAAAPKS
jgi:hypothetical protein